MSHEEQVYASDLTDEQWALIEPLIPVYRWGRPRKLSMRSVVNAILYLLVAGCQWKMLPKEYPNHNSVYHHFRRWSTEGVWEQINTVLREQVREQAGRQAQPSAASVDSQSVKTTAVGGERGFDGGKQVKGRKRNFLVDTMGNLLKVLVTVANMNDGKAAIEFLKTLPKVLFTGGIPLSLLMLHRVADVVPARKAVWRGVGLGLALGAQALSCAYYGIFAGLMIGCATLVLAAMRRLWRSAAYWTAIATGAATSLAIVLPVFLPYLRVQEQSGFARSVADTAKWAAGSRDYFMSATHAHAWLLTYMRSFGPWSGEVLFPGLFAIALGVTGVALAARRNSRDHETAIVYGTLGILAFWASFGPAGGLYRVLYCLPAFSFLRAPSRLGLVVVLCLAVFVSIALRHLFGRLAPNRRRLAAAAAVALAMADVAVFPIRSWYRAPDLPPPYAVLAASPRAPVAEFPFYGDRIAFPLHAQYMLFSTSHWMPLVNGYSDVIPRDFREAAPVLDGFPSTDAFTLLARRRVRYIAIHWDMYAGRQDDIRRRLAAYAGNLRMMADDPRMTLYEVVRVP